MKDVAIHMLRNATLDHLSFLMANQLENPMRKKNPPKQNPVAGCGVICLQYQHLREPGDYPDFKAIVRVRPYHKTTHDIPAKEHLLYFSLLPTFPPTN